jgi:hypothetical protein
MSKSAKRASKKQDDGDLAELLRQIVRDYGTRESPMPVYSPGPLLTAFHLALALDPSIVRTNKRVPGGWKSTVGPVAPPNDEAAKRAHNLKAVACILSDIMQRWKTQRRCSLQGDEIDRLLEIAALLKEGTPFGFAAGRER